MQGAESTVEVAFKGTVESLATNSTTKGEILKSSLIGITQWGTPELKTLRLEDVTALTQLAADTKGALSAITDFTSCFEGCTGLTNLPEDLFAMATGAQTFDRAFQGCTGLTSLPLNLFAQIPVPATLTLPSPAAQDCSICPKTSLQITKTSMS